MTLFPIFNPTTLAYIGNKRRDIIHAQGYWHKGIQVHLIRKNLRNSFDIFVQERSGCVDISSYKLDQSLATQMVCEDNLNEEETLRRGLFNELKISQYKSIRLPFNLRIVKRYSQHPNILNREIISLFLAISNQEPSCKDCPKIHKGYWLSWEMFITKIKKNKNSFTKTTQMYMLIPDIFTFIEKSSLKFLGKNVIVSKFNKAIYSGVFPAEGDLFYKKFTSSEKFRKFIEKDCCLHAKSC